jgi:hypothetical protein
MSFLQNSNAINGEINYQITNSLRFQSANSQYMSRTPSVSGDLRKWTYSVWLKRGLISPATQYPTIISATLSASFNDSVYFTTTSDVITWNISNTVILLQTTNVFRDPSAWYHVLLVWDTANATASNRAKIYINGIECVYTTDNRATYLNRDSTWNRAAIINYVGGSSNAVLDYDGNQTEINFINGQALTPSSFGITAPATGQWVAIKYTGTYGTNGFCYKFTNGTSTATLGTDSSGNNNTATLTSFTRVAGVADCWTTDVPSGNSFYGVQPNSNYAVLNPLCSNANISNGNLKVANAATSIQHNAIATIAITIPTYFEHTVGVVQGAGQNVYFGVGSSELLSAYPSYLGASSNGWAMWYGSGFTGKMYNAVGTNLVTGVPAVGDILMIAVDPANGKIWFGKNGTWLGSGDPVAGTNAGYTGLPSKVYGVFGVYYAGAAGGNYYNMNFGQRTFSYTPPSGYKALCTSNLPSSPISQGSDFMDVSAWTGTNGTRTFTTAKGFQPDLVWVKGRNAGWDHVLYDSVRGAGNTKELVSDLTAIEGSLNSEGYGYVSSFNSNGFTATVGNDVTYPALYFNLLTYNYVGWQWKAGGSTVSNTNGTITSQVSANTTSGFSIVSYTGTGVNASIGHGLGFTPDFIIVKKRSATGNWIVWHSSIGATQYLALNLTIAATTNAIVFTSAPTATVFNIGTDTDMNVSAQTFVAYCFRGIEGYSKFGKYVGNGSANGPFVYLGFKPKFIMCKSISIGGVGYSWFIRDSARESMNVTTSALWADSASVETANASYAIDFLSNGFKLRGVDAGENASGQTFIYIAFAESPFASANAR